MFFEAALPANRVITFLSVVLMKDVFNFDRVSFFRAQIFSVRVRGITRHSEVYKMCFGVEMHCCVDLQSTLVFITYINKKYFFKKETVSCFKKTWTTWPIISVCSTD